MNRAVSFFIFVGLGFGSFSAEKLSSGLIAKGTEWETFYYQRDSGVKGPVVFITGGVHGNEPAGARAAEQIRHWKIKKKCFPGFSICSSIFLYFPVIPDQ